MKPNAEPNDPIEALEAVMGGSNLAPDREGGADADKGADQGASAGPARGAQGQQQGQAAKGGTAAASRPEAAAGAQDADELLRELGAAADEATAEDEIFDNLALLERRQQQAEARRAAERQARARGDDGGEGGEGGEQDRGEAGQDEEGADQPGERQEEGGDEDEGDGDEGAGSWGEFLDKLGLDADGAQALLDHLLNESRHAGALRLRYRANGQDVEEPWAEVRQKAAGYAGQPEVTRRLQEADTKLREAEAKEAQASAAMQQIQALLSHIDDPAEFVAKTIAPNSGLDYMIALRDELNKHISEAESDPGSFRLQQELNAIKRTLAQLVGGEAAPARARAGAAPTAEPPSNGKRAASSAVPEDFGFVPGVGYGDHAEAVFHALREAVSIAGDGIEVQAVLDQWKSEGRRRPVFDVLRDMVKLRSSDKPKRDLARKPPATIPSGTRAGRQPTRPNPSARRPPRWEDIPDALARDLQRLMGAGS